MQGPEVEVSVTEIAPAAQGSRTSSPRSRASSVDASLGLFNFQGVDPKSVGGDLLGESPPKPKLAFRVGLLGLPTAGLNPGQIDAFCHSMRQVFQLIQSEVFDFGSRNAKLFENAGEPILRFVSPMTGEAERLAAKIALELHFELQCLGETETLIHRVVEPVPNKGSENPNGSGQVQGLLRQACEEERIVTFDVDGSANQPPAAFAISCRVVLNQSDVLVAFWDGGSTLRKTLREAVSFQVPVVWIDASDPKRSQLVIHESALGCPEGTDRCVMTNAAEGFSDLARRVHASLRPPSLDEEDSPSQEAEEPRTTLSRYLKERRPVKGSEFLWKSFRNFVFKTKRPALWKMCGELGIWSRNKCIQPLDRRLHWIVTGIWPSYAKYRERWQPRQVDPFDQAVAHEWPTGGQGFRPWINKQLLPYFAWADGLADFYADSYRSTFVTAFLLGALAVFLGILGPSIFLATRAEGHEITKKEHYFELSCEFLFLIGETGVILSIFRSVRRGQKAHWHERWTDYRLMAELFRQIRFLAPLGGGRPFPRLAPHLRGYGDPTHTWMYWYVRAVERQVGLPNQCLNQAYLYDYTSFLENCIEDQCQFHVINEDRSWHIDKRLQVWGEMLAFMTLAACGVHLFLYYWLWPQTPIPALTRILLFFCVLAAAFCPALTAALAAIRDQGEFHRLKMRSAAMKKRLEDYKGQLENLRLTRSAAGELAINPIHLADLAQRVVQLMVDEVLDWRIVFLDRPLETRA